MTTPTPGRDELRERLLPCPFCGGEAALESAGCIGVEHFRARCFSCGIESHRYADREAAASVWNRRPAAEADGLHERLEKLLGVIVRTDDAAAAAALAEGEITSMLEAWPAAEAGAAAASADVRREVARIVEEYDAFQGSWDLATAALTFRATVNQLRALLSRLPAPAAASEPPPAAGDGDRLTVGPEGMLRGKLPCGHDASVVEIEAHEGHGNRAYCRRCALARYHERHRRPAARRPRRGSRAVKLVALSRREIEAAMFPPQDGPAVAICIAYPTGRFHRVQPSGALLDVLHLRFSDCDGDGRWCFPEGKDEDQRPMPMTRGQAVDVLDFAERWRGDAETIYSACYGGVSRSRGILAGLAAVYDWDDRELYAAGVPNVWCKAIILREWRARNGARP